MIETHVELEERQREELERLARRQGRSLSEILRRLVDEALESERARPRNPAAGLLEIAGIGRSGLGDLARRHDEYLVAETDP